METEKKEKLPEGNWLMNVKDWFADLILLIFAIILFLSGNSTFSIERTDLEGTILQFILVLTIVPWYGGYLLHHFEVFPKAARITLQWIFALVTLGMIVFLIIFMFPLLETNTNDPFQVFLLAFGMFFMVLGPLMFIGGYSDSRFIDDPIEPDKPIQWPIVTLTMLIIIASIFFMILIIGLFDPTWTGNASFFVVLLGFLGGPMVAILLSIPFVYLGKVIEDKDRSRIILRSARFIIPVFFFLILLRWNELVLSKAVLDWGGGQTSSSIVFTTLLLSGVIPFRILMLLKPPISYIQLLIGICSLLVYMASLAFAYSH